MVPNTQNARQPRITQQNRTSNIRRNHTTPRSKKKVDPTCDGEQRHTFLKSFSWDNSILNEQEQERIEALLVKHHMIFARHRMDIGLNTDFKINLTPKHDDPVYARVYPLQPT